MYYFEIRKRQSHLYWPLRKENHILRIIMSSNHNILIHMSFASSRASLVAQLVKNQPEMWEAWLRSLGREPPPVFLPGKSHGRRSLVGCSPWGRKRVRHDRATNTINLVWY